MEIENIVDKSPQIPTNFLYVYKFLEVYCFLMVDNLASKMSIKIKK